MMHSLIPTVTSKTVAIPNLDVVHEVHHKHLWELYLALVRANKLQTLATNWPFGSCNLAQVEI